MTKKEWILWILSMAAIALSAAVSAALTGKPDHLTLAAALIGVTSLIFAASGNAWAQILMIFFCILYGMISHQFCYWGEMITYLGMSLPMAVWSLVTWLSHPSENGGKVEIQRLSRRQVTVLLLSAAVVTAVFSLLLYRLNTPKLIMSCVSIATSYLAAALTMLRSSYYAAGYAANDIVLILLWVYVSMENPLYLTVAVNFAIFLINDFYGFLQWKKREKLQMQNNAFVL